MKSFKQRVVKVLDREFVEGTIFRVDLDRVDVAPNGSSGILRSLPLTGDRDKVKPGDPVKVLTVAGERVALAGDVAVDDVVEAISADASEIELDEKVGNASGTVKPDGINAITLNGLYPAPAGADAHIVQTSETGGIVATGSLTAWGGMTVDGGVALNGSVMLSGDPTTVNGQLNLNPGYGGSLPLNMRAQSMLSGGGAITVTSDNYVKWGTRFIVISAGMGSHASTSGYFNIDMPAAATTIQVHGNAGVRTVDATKGILVGSWESLYYELPIGSGAPSVAGNFHVVFYTGEFDVPVNWIFICGYNADNATYRFGNGMFIKPGEIVNVGQSPRRVTINFVIDGGGAVITTGEKGVVEVPYPMYLDTCDLLADVAGSIGVGIYKCDYTAYNTSWTGLGTPTIASAVKSQTSLGWSLNSNDILRFYVSSIATITRCTVALRGYVQKP